MKVKLAKSEIIHFIGIGGIGMSGLSLIMRGKGFKVQGSDIASNKNIERLKKEKIKIAIGHKKQNINKATIIVALLIFCFLCPIVIFIFSFFNLSIFLLLAMSLP